MRRPVLIMAVLALVVGLSSPAVAADPPAKTCQARLSIPSKLAIDAAQLRVPMSFHTDCPDAEIKVDFDGPGYADGYIYATFGDPLSTGNLPALYLAQSWGSYVARLDSAASTGDIRNQGSITPLMATVRFTAKFKSWAFVASSRRGSAVYINGLVKHIEPNGSGTPRPYSHAVVYLQRYLNGHWQNVLSRTARLYGDLAVGFIDPQVRQYRLVTVETSSNWSATSGSTFR